MTNEEMLILIMYVVGGLVVGLLINKLLFPVIKKFTQKTSIKTDDLIVSIVGKWIVPWFFALGIFLGLQEVDMPVKYYNWVERGLTIFYLLSATIILAKILSGLVSIKSGATDSVLPSSSIISKIVKVLIYFFGLILILQSQGVSVLSMLTAVGVGGLAVALALQNTLANLFAGLQIISSGKVNNGDQISLTSGEEGTVQDISWRSTTIKAANDHLIIVPNSKMADLIIHNYNLPELEFTFNVPFGVSYDSDLKKVETVTLEVIQEILSDVEGGVTEGWQPFIRYYNFGDSSVDVKAFMRVKAYSNQFLMRHEFMKLLHERFAAEKINIPFPIRTVIMKKDAEE